MHTKGAPGTDLSRSFVTWAAGADIDTLPQLKFEPFGCTQGQLPKTGAGKGWG